MAKKKKNILEEMLEEMDNLELEETQEEDVESDEDKPKKKKRPIVFETFLRAYTRGYITTQAQRIRHMGVLRSWYLQDLPPEEKARLKALKTKFDDAYLMRLPEKALPGGLLKPAQVTRALEAVFSKSIRKEIEKEPLWPYLKGIHGISHILAARLIYNIKVIDRFPSVSNIWSYAGLDGPEWRQNKRSHDLTKVCYSIAESFQRCKPGTSPYRDIYDERKAYEMTRPWCGKCKTEDEKTLMAKGQEIIRESCTPGHMNKKARRYTVKAFLKDLWVHHHTLKEDSKG